MIVEFFGHFLDLSRLSYVSTLYLRPHYAPGTQVQHARSLEIEICFGGNPVEITLFRQTILFNEVSPEQALEWSNKGNQIRAAIFSLLEHWLTINNQAVTKLWTEKMEQAYPTFRMPVPPAEQPLPTPTNP